MSYCLEHVLRIAAGRWLEDSSRWQELQQLFDRQEGRCAYTGEILVLGGNASLDHKTPRSRGGRNELSNLQWVAWTVNRVKTDLTHEEFLALCRTVISRAG